MFERVNIFPALVSALIAGVLSWTFNYHGVFMGPDSWAYWEGSVSLLEGFGYRHFWGRPLTEWPPFYSSYLALVQKFFGISGFSLVLSLIFLAAGSAFL